MREIKFRAFMKGQMIEGVQPLFDSVTPTKCMVPGMGIVFHEPSGTKRYWYEVPVDAIMQYTGLKDKNGKDIYEGDIVRYLNGETTSTENGMDCSEFNTDGIIYWEYDSAQWDITHRIHVSREDVFTDITTCEIVGNKYQNPELIA